MRSEHRDLNAIKHSASDTPILCAIDVVEDHAKAETNNLASYLRRRELVGADPTSTVLKGLEED